MKNEGKSKPPAELAAAEEAARAAAELALADHAARAAAEAWRLAKELVSAAVLAARVAAEQARNAEEQVRKKEEQVRKAEVEAWVMERSAAAKDAGVIRRDGLCRRDCPRLPGGCRWRIGNKCALPALAAEKAKAEEAK
jgi:hypothetical protein